VQHAWTTTIKASFYSILSNLSLHTCSKISLEPSEKVASLLIELIYRQFCILKILIDSGIPSPLHIAILLCFRGIYRNDECLLYSDKIP